MRPLILFIDPDCPKAYDYTSFREKPLGGTESTMLRISEGLARRGYSIVVAQGNRNHHEKSPAGVLYIPFHRKSLAVLPQQPSVVVILNTSRLLKWMAATFPKANRYLWLHCFPGKRRRKILNADAVASNTAFITVSHTLADELKKHLNNYPVHGKKEKKENRFAQVHTLYNPIDDRLLPDARMYRPYKLVFFSSPHKGLWEVLEAFSALHAIEPRYHLYIANPGYVSLPKNLDTTNIHILGVLPHREVIRHVREAFCVFYPQKFFRETFGLVFAEANAVGTPVLTHPHGAAEEVLENKQQLVDVSNLSLVVERLQLWQKKGRPGVRLPSKFRQSHVLNRWEQLLQLGNLLTRPISREDKAEKAYAADEGS